MSKSSKKFNKKRDRDPSTRELSKSRDGGDAPESGEKVRDSGKGRKGIAGVPGSKNPDRRCSATARKTGEQCKRAAIRGGFVCTTHGGAAPQVKKAAKERLMDLVDPALSELHRVLTDKNAEDAVKVRAALGILDRTGHGPGSKIELGIPKFDEAIAAAYDLDPETGKPRAGTNRALDGPETRPALVGGGGEHSWEDYDQHASDANAETWREYDAEDAEEYERGRIRPDENTVRGEVVDPVQSPYDAPLPSGPTDPPRYAAEPPLSEREVGNARVARSRRP